MTYWIFFFFFTFRRKFTHFTYYYAPRAIILLSSLLYILYARMVVVVFVATQTYQGQKQVRCWQIRIVYVARRCHREIIMAINRSKNNVNNRPHASLHISICRYNGLYVYELTVICVYCQLVWLNNRWDWIDLVNVRRFMTDTLWVREMSVCQRSTSTVRSLKR